MSEYLTQRIEQRLPSGGYSPGDQVSLAYGPLRHAARLLECAIVEELEDALERLHTPLVALCGAGVLCALALHLHDEFGSFGVTVTFDTADVGEYEEVDLSRLALLANPQAVSSLEITCLNVPLARALVSGAVAPALTGLPEDFCQVLYLADAHEAPVSEEERNEYDDFDQDGDESFGEVRDISDERDSQDGLPD